MASSPRMRPKRIDTNTSASAAARGAGFTLDADIDGRGEGAIVDALDAAGHLERQLGTGHALHHAGETQRFGRRAGGLQRLDDRNKDQAERNGLFASHPDTKARIQKANAQASALKATALVAARYKQNVKYEASAITSIAVVTEGSAGLAGGGKDEEKGEPKKDEPKADKK